MRAALPRLLLLVLLWMCGTGLPAGAETRLDIPQSRALVVRFLETHDYDSAYGVTSVLIRRPGVTPGDRLLHARALRGLGRHDEAQELAREVFSNAEEPALRYAAALVVAQALSSDGNKTFAQLWLRRAAEIAPDPVSRAQAVQDFRYVRATNPWTVGFRFGITPSSNVNGAPTDNTFIWNGLTFIDPSLVPLSGYQIATGLSVEHRLLVTPDSRLRFGLIVDDSQVVLSDAARRKVPSARGSDYDFRATEAHITMDWSTSARSAQTTGLVFGRNWSGGQHLTDYLRAEAQSLHALSQRDSIGVSFAAERQWRQDAAIRSGDVLTVGSQWRRALSGGAELALGLTLSDMSAASADIAHRKARVDVTYALGQPVLGALATLSVGMEGRWYDRPLYIAAPREDKTLQIGGRLIFTGFDLFGFAPKVGLTATRTNSNVSRFETEAVELNLGLQSVF